MGARGQDKWLAGESDYQDYVESLSVSDPRLRSRDPKAVTQRTPWADDGVRLVRLEWQQPQPGSGAGGFGEAVSFGSPRAFGEYFDRMSSADQADKSPDKSPDEPDPDRGLGPGGSGGGGAGSKAVYILEGLGPGWVAALGSRFGVHPSFFLEHERVIVMNRRPQGESDGLPLPSALGGRAHLSLRYFEVVHLDRRPASFRLVCADTGRHIGVSRADDGEFMSVGIVRRKCGVWTRMTGGGGWDCLILCDPPVRCVRTGDEYKDKLPVKARPYQGGYVDFVPQQAQVRAGGSRRPGPPRTSMLDDLVFYLQSHAAAMFRPPPPPPPPATAPTPTTAAATAAAVGEGWAAGRDRAADPDAVVGTFVRKLVASHYHKHAEHLRAVLSAAQRALSRKHDLARLPMGRVEELWSDVQAWERRMGEYCEDLEGIMLQLGIPLKQPSTEGAGGGVGLWGGRSHNRLGDDPYYYSHYSYYAQTPTGHDSPSLSRAPTVSCSYTRLGDAISSAPSTASLQKLKHDSSNNNNNNNSNDSYGGAGVPVAVAAAAAYTGPGRWLDSTADFQFLLHRFRELRHRTECLNAAVTGLASITGNRQAYREQQLALSAARRSIREAKSSKAVTLLGLVFIPLAYTSQVFSMSSPYGPGGELFWQYFAWSAPLILLVLAAYYVLDMGYSDDGAAWSFWRFVGAVRGKVSAEGGNGDGVQEKRGS